MSKNNKFYVKKIKKDNITVAEEKNYKSPFILFLVANGRLIFIITLLLSITTLIISTSLVFRNMLGSTYKSDKNNTNTTTDNSNVVVTVDISDECNLNNTTPITEEYATKLFDSSRQINTANTGVVIKVKEKPLEDRIIIFYSDKTALIKYKDGSKLIGFCGYSKECSNKHKLSKKFYGFVKNRLYKSKSIKNLKAFKEYENNYNYIPEKLKNHFDGEVSILIVDEDYRGKKIGKKLLLDVFELAKKDNMKNIQIVTDESCNYKFYESLGCKKVYETIVENKEIEQLGNGYTEKAFIYEKKL